MDCKHKVLMNIAEIKETADIDEVNRLLKGEWFLLDTYFNKQFIFVLAKNR